jgi:hypothetical protein
MIIPPKVYEPLKWIAMTVLPALATLILALGLTWDMDNAGKIATTITIVNAFLGTILQISSLQFKSYLKTDEAFDGYVSLTGRNDDTNIPDMKFTISRHPEDFLQQGVVRMKIGNPPPIPVKREPLPEAEVDVQPIQHDGP